MLAARLKELRLRAKRSRDEAAEHIGVAPSTVTKIENATAVAPVGNVALLLDLYKVVDEEHREFLFSLARDARKRDWFQPYKKVIPPWFETFVGLETEAVELRGYYPELIPGLLQTSDYHQAYLRNLAIVPTPGDIDKQVAFRAARQERLTGSDGPAFWTIINEAALRRTVGGSATMRAQLAQLREFAERPNITLQVLPFSAGAHSAMDGGFVVLEFPERSHTDVVYLESQTDSRYLEEPEVVARYNLVFNHLRAHALSTEQSLSQLDSLRKSV